MSRSEGYITAATNHRKHVEMAADLRLSLAEHDPARGFAVVVDEARADFARSLGVFDHVVVIPKELNFGHAGKLFTGQASPWDHTLFLDADCLAVGSLEPLWEHFPTRSFCVPGMYVEDDDKRHHHNYPIADLCTLFEIPRYYFASSPMVYFDDPGREIMAECLAAYVEELPAKGVKRWDRPWPPDEIAFGVVGGRREYANFPPVQTIIKHRDLPNWTVGSPPHPVYHCTMSPSLRVLSDLMKQVHRRRRAREMPQGSRRHWVQKALYKRGQRALTNALGLPWTNPLRRNR